jgi:F-type H+-transporting ATPase subunit b
MSRCSLLFGCLVLALAVFAWQAPASRAAGEPGHASTASSHASEGSEKVDIFQRTDIGPAVDLGIWTIAVFLILFGLLWFMAWKPLREGLLKREHGIQAAIDEAKRAREEAQRLREQWQQEMDAANDKVRDILDLARRDAQHTTEEMVGKARSEIQTERDRLRREIETARDQAIQELWNHTANLAALVSAKAIRRQLTPDDHRRLVEESLAELGKANGPRAG